MSSRPEQTSRADAEMLSSGVGSALRCGTLIEGTGEAHRSRGPIVRSSQTASDVAAPNGLQPPVGIRTTWCSLPKAQLCALPRRSIRYRCCTLQRRMAMCRLDPLPYRTRRPTPWTCGTTRAWPRGSSGNGPVTMLAYQMTFAGSRLRTRMRSPAEDGNRECGFGRLDQPTGMSQCPFLPIRPRH